MTDTSRRNSRNQADCPHPGPVRNREREGNEGPERESALQGHEIGREGRESRAKGGGVHGEEERRGGRRREFIGAFEIPPAKEGETVVNAPIVS